MTVTQCEIRPGAYYDSIVLMQLQRSLAELPGVADAGVVMATPANLSLLKDRDLYPGQAAGAGPDDLLIVVRGDDASTAGALAQIDDLLARRRSSASQSFRPRSLEAAFKSLKNAQWVLISVPGRYAAGVAREALAHGRNVFLYSDNVSVEDEVSLKATAREKGLLVMGPDCGTAIVSGVGLGFANRVRRGPIGLVGASGTGLQAITAGVHNLGSGVSHALGTGGRDLHEEVGATTALQALDLLKRDADTRVITLVSKPPAPVVAARLLLAAQATGKPTVIHFLGQPPPGSRLGRLHFATSLSQAAELSVALLDGDSAEAQAGSSPLQGTRRYVRGLFAGGTLAYEALLGLQSFLSPLYSNTPVRPDQSLEDPSRSRAHTILDLGDDAFTVGRLHPMLDSELRLHRLRLEAADPEVAVILLDVVLGEGAHPDPASELAPAVAEVAGKGEVEVLAVVLGTEDDPQGLEGQVERLEGAGARVFRSVNQALEYLLNRLPPDPLDGEPVDPGSIQAPLAAVNVGLESFYDSLTGQGAQAVHVDWRPPAGGDERLMAILAKMKGK